MLVITARGAHAELIDRHRSSATYFKVSNFTLGRANTTMSAAASKLLLQSPNTEFNPLPDSEQEDESQLERELLDKLSTISPPTSSGPVIAIDLDDVLSQTNKAVALCKQCLW